MGYAVIVGPGDQRSHRNDELGIIILNGPEIPELPFACCLVGNEVCGLDINSRAGRLCADEIDFSGMQLADRHLKTQTNEVIIYDILDDFFDVPFAFSSGQVVPDAVVFEEKLVIAFK